MKLIIFDLDGTLVDSEIMYTQLFIELLQKHNQKVDVQLIHDAIGISFDDFYEILAKKWNPTKRKEEIKSLFEQIHWQEIFDWNDLLFPFVRYCLKTLKKEGLILTIASGSPMTVIQDMLEKTELSSYFDGLYTADDCLHGKPHPEIFMKVMDAFKIEPKDTIIVEDSIHGIEAGKASGAYVIAHKEDRLAFSQEKADYIAEDFIDITNYILERKRNNK